MSQSLIHQGENSIRKERLASEEGLISIVSIPYSSGGKFNRKVMEQIKKVLESQSLIHQGENSMLKNERNKRSKIGNCLNPLFIRGKIQFSFNIL